MKLSSVKPFFPHAFKANDLKGLVIALVIYAIVAVVLSFALGLLSAIPVIGFVSKVAGWLADLYCTAGVIFSILVFLNVIK